MDPSDPDDVLTLARWLHEEYERHSAEVGWETQDGTSTDFGDLPPDNKSVMIPTARSLLEAFDVSDHPNA